MIVSYLYIPMFLSSMVVDAYVATFITSSSITRSSFVGRRNTIHCPSSISSVSSNLHQQQQKSSTCTTTTTILHMNLFDRFSRVAKSNLNNILQSLEDPEKIMTQALEDMQVWICLNVVAWICTVAFCELLWSEQYRTYLIALTLFLGFEILDRSSQNSSILRRSYRNTTSITETKRTSRCGRYGLVQTCPIGTGKRK